MFFLPTLDVAGDDARKSVGVGRGGTVLPTILEEYPRIWGLNINVVINKRSQRKVSTIYR